MSHVSIARAVVLVMSAQVAVSCARKAEPSGEPQGRAPERGPRPAHPRFPTAASAGSEGIFALEEPDRGPLVTTLALPPEGGGETVTMHGHCEIDYDAIVCGPAGDAWRLRMGPRYAVAERRFGTLAHEQMVVERSVEGRVTRMVSADAGVVKWSRHFDGEARRYSARFRSGANALPGCGAMALQRDEHGRVERATCLQWLGDPMRDTAGVVTTVLSRNEQGLPIQWSYLGADGAPTARHDGVQRVVAERDAAGRIVRWEYRDGNGQLVREGDGGCATRVNVYGEDGSPSEERCLDPSGAVVADVNGVAIRRMRYDRAGCLIAERYFDGEGKPAASRFAGHGFDFEQGTGCRPVAATCVGASGRPAPCAAGEYARVVLRYNDRGDVVARRFLDARGGPSSDPSFEAAELRNEVDDRGRVTSESCFGPEGGAIECKDTGYHRSSNTVDDAARVVSMRFFDTAGKPTTNLGTFEARSTFDNYDHLVEALYLDAKGNPTAMLGASSRTTLYDPGHRVFAELLFAGDAPAKYEGCFTGRTCPALPWHAVRVVRGPSGEVVGNEFFDADKQLIETIDCRIKRCFGL